MPEINNLKVYMYVNAKTIPVEIIPGMGKRS
jgi:hypothetical protein